MKIINNQLTTQHSTAMLALNINTNVSNSSIPQNEFCVMFGNTNIVEDLCF